MFTVLFTFDSSPVILRAPTEFDIPHDPRILMKMYVFTRKFTPESDVHECLRACTRNMHKVLATVNFKNKCQRKKTNFANMQNVCGM